MYGTVDYSNGIIQINSLLKVFDIEGLATIAYDTYVIQSDKATLVDASNN